MEEFKQIYLIGYNENKCFTPTDDYSGEHIRPPFILGAHQNDDVSGASAKIAKKYIENLIMHCSMPEGVSYKKPKGIILSQQIVAMQQILEQQLASIEQRELET